MELADILFAVVLVAGLSLLARFGAAVLVLAVIFPARVDFFLGTPLTAFEVLLLPALLVELQRYRKSVPNRPRGIGSLVLVALIGWGLLSVLWAEDPLSWVRRSEGVLGGLVAGWALYYWTLRTRVQSVLLLWAGSGVAAAAVALVWFFGMGSPSELNLQPPGSAADALSQELRLGSPMWGPSNYFASFLLLSVPFCSVAFARRGARIAAITVILVALGATLSRGAAVSVAIGCLAAMIMSPRVRAWLLHPVMLMMVAPTAVLMAALHGPRAMQSLLSERDLSGGAFDTNSRGAIYEHGVELFLERPVLGGGLGNWQVVSEGFAATGAHNFLLHAAVELGVIGLVLVVAATASLIRVARTIGNERIATATVLSLVLVLSNCLLQASMEGVVFSWYFAMFIGMVVGLNARLNGHGECMRGHVSERGDGPPPPVFPGEDSEPGTDPCPRQLGRRRNPYSRPAS